MKTTLPAESARDLKDYESLIENGYVLDVRGKWIPLNEKIKKERSFIKHLQSGEVLISGKWLTISDALKNEQDVSLSSNKQEQQAIENPQSITIPHDETHTSFDLVASEQEIDFPPETIMIPAEEILQNNPIFQDSVLKIKNNVFINDQQQNAEESIITQETIAMSLHALPEITAQYQKPFGNIGNLTTFTTHSGSALSDQVRSKRKVKLFMGVAAIAIIICALSFLALKHFPGLLQ